MNNNFDAKFENEQKKQNQSLREESLSKAKSEVEKVTNKIKNNVSNILISIGFGFITLVLLGAMTLINAEYDASKILTFEFLSQWVTLQITVFVIRIWFTNMRKNKEMNVNEPYLITKKGLQELIELDGETPFIEHYAKIDDKDRKVNAFKNGIKLKIHKLSYKYKLNFITSFIMEAENENTFDLLKEKGITSDIDISNVKFKKRWLKKLDKVEKKIVQYLIYLTDDWILVNIDSVKVKYNGVSRDLLTNGFSAKKDNLNGETYEGNAVKNFMLQFLPAFIMVTAFTFVIKPLSSSDFNTNLDAWLLFFTNLFSVVFSGFTAWNSGRTLFEKDILTPLMKRENRIKIYHKQYLKDKQ